MAHASYKRAIEWMVENDDTEWVAGDPQSVTAALVADMFGKTDDRVRRDLFNALKRAGRIARGVKLEYDERSAHSYAA